MAFLSSFYPQPVVKGTTAGTFAEGNDPRLSDARTPLSHAHGNISNTGTIGSTSGLPVVTTTSGAISTLALGTANQVLRVNSGATGVEFGAGFDAASPPAIGNTTPSTGAFTTLSAAPTSGSALTLTGGTVTASAPLIDATQTWNNVAVAFTGLRLNVTNTASAASSLYESIRLAGDQVYELAASRAVRLYNTSSSLNANHERGFMRWSSNVFQIGTERSGSGVARALELSVDGNRRMYIGTDGEVGIGSVAGLQSSHGIVINPASSQTSITHGTGRILVTSAAVSMNSNVLRVDSGRVMFGGTTSSFPSLKQSSTTLQVRLADDSDFAPLACAGLTLNGDLTASTRNIVTDTTTGTKIGTATTQKIGFFDKTPVVQPTAVADATDAATVITQLNALLSRMRDLGLIAT